MNTERDQLLCDYIFGLLEEPQKKIVEFQLKESKELATRFKELNETFCGLDSVKEDFSSPVSKLLDSLYRLSYACATVASALTIFWITAFGSVKGNYTETTYSAHNSDSVNSGISCISGTAQSKKITCQFSNLTNFRE